MSIAPAEDTPRVVARGDGELGEVVLRQRAGPVYELVVNGVFLMDTADTTTERLLAATVLARHPEPRRVLVGGLGLGCTLAELLADPRPRRIDVVEIEPLLVEWSRHGLVPGVAGLLADPRVRVEVADVQAWLAEVSDPYDAIVLDVDNGPGFLVHERNATLYRPAGLAAAARALRPGGLLAIWSADPAPELYEAARTCVGPAQVLRHRVVRQGRELAYHLHVSIRPGPTGGHRERAPGD